MATASVWNRLPTGAATVLGEPAADSGNGAVSSSCTVLSLEAEKRGSLP